MGQLNKGLRIAENNNIQRRHKGIKKVFHGVELGNKITAFSVVGSLVLQPLAISLNTSNLLTIVVRNRVGDRIG